MTTTRTADPPAGRFDPALRRLALVVVLGVIMTILDTTIVNVAITTLGRDLSVSLSTIQWVLTGYTLAMSMAIPLTGWAVDRFGGKTMWITALTLFLGGSLLCGAAWSAASLIAFRVVQGLGGGILLPVGQTMLARAAGPGRMGRVMAVVSLPAMLAPVCGPALGGLIVDHLSWRWMFFVNIPVCLLALLLAVRLLPCDDAGRQPAGRLDTMGLAMLSPGLAALIYGLSEVGNGAGATDPELLVSLGLAVVLVGGFVVHSLRTPGRPLIDVRVFRHRPFGAAVSALFCYSVAMFGLLIVVPLYFQIVRAYGPPHAGLLIAPLGLGAMVTMPLSGRITDRAGSRGVGVAGILVALAGAAAYTRLDVSTSDALLAGALFVVGLGHGLLIPALTAAPYQGLSTAAMPGATAAANVMLRVATSIGGAVLAVVLQINIRAEVPGASGSLAAAARTHDPATTALLTHAFARSIWWVLGLCAVAAVIALTIPTRRRPVGSDDHA